MITKNLGGNKARYLNVFRGNIKFSGSKYNYSHIKINDKEKEIKLNYFTVFVLSKKKRSKLIINKKIININEGDCINFYNHKINTFSSKLGDISLLISGVKKIKKKKELKKLKKANYTQSKNLGDTKNGLTEEENITLLKKYFSNPLLKQVFNITDLNVKQIYCFLEKLN